MGIEFSADIVEFEGATLVVKGRCLEGPIRTRDVFTATYGLDDPRSDTPARVDEAPVLLRIEKISAYRRDFDEIDPGLTARLELVGVGLAEVKAGRVLGQAR